MKDFLDNFEKTFYISDKLNKMKNTKVISSNYTGNSLNMVYSEGGKVQTKIIQKSNPNWEKVVKAYKKQDFKELLNLIDTPSAIERAFKGEFTVKNGKVYRGGEECHSYLAGRIIFFAQEGLPYKNLLKFAKNLDANPSQETKNNLYKFLEHGNFPITDRGTFLGYKKVKDDFYSVTAGKANLIKGTSQSGYIFNGIGEIIEVDRSQVDSNVNNGCSFGLHVGSHFYSTHEFNSGSGRSLIVEVDPKDVVAVPADYNFQKLRTCKYKVIAEEGGRKLDEVKDRNLGKSKPKRDANGRFLARR